jgi:site-specific DNA-methyltransferase (adenine-specific)
MSGRLEITGDTETGYADSGSAARFFYTAKASRDDREDGNTHPTVKPTDLMRYLCRLVTPPGGIVLDPFMGSGSTGKAAMLEGFGFIGIEREAPSYAIAQHRISRAQAAGHQPDLFASAGPVA